METYLNKDKNYLKAIYTTINEIYPYKDYMHDNLPYIKYVDTITLKNSVKKNKRKQ